MKKFLTFFAIATMMSLVACSDDTQEEEMEEEMETEVTYTNTIQSELSGCASAGCHNSGAAVGSLANYDDVVTFVGFGRILGALRQDEGFSPMPKGGTQWTDAQVTQLSDWINAGLPE